MRYCLDLMTINFLAKKTNFNGILQSINTVNNKITKFQTKKILNKFNKKDQIAILGSVLNQIQMI